MTTEQDLRFELAAHEVVDLLVGNHIYEDAPRVVVRELLQNAVDACRLAQKLDPERQAAITVAYFRPQAGRPGRLVVQDNGIGMTDQVVRHFFLRVGRSYYSSAEFRAHYPGLAFTPIARFGIGALSCFLVADLVCLETRHISGAEPVRLEIEGPHSRIRRSTPAAGPAGTRLELFLRPEVEYGNLVQVVTRWAAHLEFPVRVEVDGRVTVVPADDGSGFRRVLLDPANFLLRDPARRHQLRTRRITFDQDGIHGFVEYLYVAAPGHLRRPNREDARGLIEVYGDQAPRRVSLDGIYVNDRLPAFLAGQGSGIAYDINLSSGATGVQLQLNRQHFVQNDQYRALVARLDEALVADMVQLVTAARLTPVQLAESLSALVDLKQVLRHQDETGSTAVVAALGALPAYPLRIAGERRYLDWPGVRAHHRIVRVPVGAERVEWPESAAHLADDFWWARHFHLAQALAGRLRETAYYTAFDGHSLMDALVSRHYERAAVIYEPLLGLSAPLYQAMAAPAGEWAGLPVLPFVTVDGRPVHDVAISYCGGWTLNRHHPVVAACLTLPADDPRRWGAEKPWRDLVALLGPLPGDDGPALADAAAAQAAGALGLAPPAGGALGRHDTIAWWMAEWERWLLEGGNG